MDEPWERLPIWILTSISFQKVKTFLDLSYAGTRDLGLEESMIKLNKFGFSQLIIITKISRCWSIFFNKEWSNLLFLNFEEYSRDFGKSIPLFILSNWTVSSYTVTHMWNTWSHKRERTHINPFKTIPCYFLLKDGDVQMNRSLCWLNCEGCPNSLVFTVNQINK